DGVVGGGQVGLDAHAAGLDVAAGPVGADPLHAAAREHLLRRHVEQAVLEAGAAQVRNQDLHLRLTTKHTKHTKRRTKIESIWSFGRVSAGPVFLFSCLSCVSWFPS